MGNTSSNTKGWTDDTSNSRVVGWVGGGMLWVYIGVGWVYVELKQLDE